MAVDNTVRVLPWNLVDRFVGTLTQKCNLKIILINFVCVSKWEKEFERWLYFRRGRVLFIVNSTHHVNNTLRIRSTRLPRLFEDAEAHLSVIACTFWGRIWSWRSRKHGTAEGWNYSAVCSTTRMCIYNPTSLNFSSSSQVNRCLQNIICANYWLISIGTHLKWHFSDSFDIRSFFQLHDLNRFVFSLKKTTIVLRKPHYFT